MALVAPPLELLEMIAEQMRQEDGGLRYHDFNAFLQANQVLCSSLNSILWREAAGNLCGTTV
jgi:hypothetical protein